MVLEVEFFGVIFWYELLFKLFKNLIKVLMVKLDIVEVV